MPTKKTKRAQKKKKRAQKRNHRAEAKKSHNSESSEIVQAVWEAPDLDPPETKRASMLAIMIGNPNAKNVTVIDASENPLMGLMALLLAFRRNRSGRTIDETHLIEEK